MLIRLLVLAVGYLFGLFQTGYLISNFILHRDLRKEGSGNSGATNALRVFGPGIGALVLLGDAGKAVIYCCLIRFLAAPALSMSPDLLSLYAAAGVILGHCYPFYMGFKGGKGIASTAGLIAVYDIRIGVICLLVFVLVVALTRYVSLGSLCVLTVFAVCVAAFHMSGLHPVTAETFPETMVLSLLLAVSAFFTHRANIVRLCHGTENKISFHKTKEK